MFKRAFPPVRWVLLLVLALAALPLTGQDLSASKLRLKESVPVASSHYGPLMVEGPVKCDGHGNVYLRKYEMPDTGAAPIVRISGDGKSEDTFDIRSAPGFEKGAAYDFAIGLRGEVYILAAKTIGQWHILKFDADGRYDSAVLLQPFLEPRQLAVFRSGELLVSGEGLSEKDAKPTGRLLSAIYDRSGKLIREISLPRDVLLEPEGGQGFSLSLSTAVAADDGNVYVMRPTDSPLVYAVSPGGSVLRRLVIPPPGESFRPNTLNVAGSRIVIEFERDNPAGPGGQQVLTVVDSETGEKLADYVQTPEAGGILACYTPDGFTFLSTTGETRGLTIIRATPY